MRTKTKISMGVLAAAAATTGPVTPGAFGATVAGFKAALGSTTAQTINDSPVVTEILSNSTTAMTETFLAQDSSGGIEVYAFNTSGGYTPAVGDTVSVTGFSGAFHGLYEAEASTANSITVAVTKTGTAAVPTPVAFTLAGLQNGSTVGQSQQSDIGTLSAVTFNGSTGTFASGGTYSLGNGSGLFATVYVPSTDTAIIGTAIPTGTVNVTGYLGQYDSAAATNAASTNGYELDPLSITTSAVPEPTTLAAAGVATAATLVRRRRRQA